MTTSHLPLAGRQGDDGGPEAVTPGDTQLVMLMCGAQATAGLLSWATDHTCCGPVPCEGGP